MSNRVAELRLRLLAQLPDLEDADHVRRRLAGHGDVPVDLGRRARVRFRGVRQHVVDRLLARPSERVHAGVHDQPRRAQRFVRQQAQPIDIRAEQSHLIREPFGVQPPALAEARQEEIPLNGMQVLLFERDRALQVMTRIRFVERRGLEARAALLGRLVRVQQILARLAIGRRRHRLPAWRGLLEKRGIRLDDDGRRRHVAKRLRHRVLRALDGGFGRLDEFVAALEAVLRIGLHQLQERLGIVRVEAAAPDLLHLRGDLRHLRQAEVVDLLRRHVDRGVVFHRGGVAGLALRVGRDANRLTRGGQIRGRSETPCTSRSPAGSASSPAPPAAS